MSLRADTIKPAKGARQTSKRVGRGNASGKGNTSARGMKGQKARSGSSGTSMIGFKQSLQKIPKLRGFKSPHAKPATVTLSMLSAQFADGDTVTPAALAERKMIKSETAGAKVVATGTITKKLHLNRMNVSVGAKEAIEKAGGTINEA
jgi:large subunit ribosomal protein L15